MGLYRREATATLRAYLVLVGVLIGVEAAIGLGLLVAGHRPPQRLHYVYAVAVALAIPVAWRFAARPARGEALALLSGSIAVVLLGIRAVTTGG